MSSYATLAESTDDPPAPSVYSEMADNLSAPSVYSEIADDTPAPAVYSEIYPSQMFDDVVAVPSAPISSFAFHVEESSNLFSQSKHRYQRFRRLQHHKLTSESYLLKTNLCPALTFHLSNCH